MKKFIKTQIDSFNGKIYKKIDLLNKNNTVLLKIQIINNQLIYDKKILKNDWSNRKKNIIIILLKMLEKYKVKDTILFLNFLDGYFYREDIPVFNFSIPIGECGNGLIFPNFDIYDYIIKNKLYDFDELKDKIINYNITKIENNIYFRGCSTTINKVKIREKLEEEKYPLNVILNKYQELWKFKNHKYLLDLPGNRPLSVRLKYLFLMNSIIFRISFYNSNYYERSYYRQSFDYLFKENRDYVHLIYDFDYEKEIPENIYKKIVSDIKDKYIYYEKNEKEYKKMVSNMKKASKKLNLDEMLKYLHTLIETYTKKLLI